MNEKSLISITSSHTKSSQNLPFMQIQVWRWPRAHLTTSTGGNMLRSIWYFHSDSESRDHWQTRQHAPLCNIFSLVLSTLSSQAFFSPLNFLGKAASRDVKDLSKNEPAVMHGQLPALSGSQWPTSSVCSRLKRWITAIFYAIDSSHNYNSGW